MESKWTFTLSQSERGWDVGGHSDQGSSLPETSYPNASKAIARVMQLMECPGPVLAQEHPENVFITRD